MMSVRVGVGRCGGVVGFCESVNGVVNGVGMVCVVNDVLVWWAW